MSSLKLGQKYVLSWLLIIAAASEADAFEESRTVRAFGIIDPNKVYRSGQPINRQFPKMRKELGLKSVLILHASMQEEVAKEIEDADRNGVTVLHLPISDNKPLSDEKLHQIVQFLKDSPKPLLIHCRAGADRTGLVSAIYQNLFMGACIESAKRDMLNFNWGHIGFGGTKAMDDYFLKDYPGKVEDLKNLMGSRLNDRLNGIQSPSSSLSAGAE